MTQDRLDILDREERLFKSIKTTIDLMATSESQEVRNTYELLGFLFDEYGVCRSAMAVQKN